MDSNAPKRRRNEAEKLAPFSYWDPALGPDGGIPPGDSDPQPDSNPEPAEAMDNGSSTVNVSVLDIAAATSACDNNVDGVRLCRKTSCE